MNEKTDERVVHFRKEANGKTLVCRLYIGSDGSAYVEGEDEDMEIVFEESPTAFRDAINYLEQLGYREIRS